MLNIKFHDEQESKKLQPYFDLAYRPDGGLDLSIHDGNHRRNVMLLWISRDGTLWRALGARVHLNCCNYADTGIKFDAQGRIKSGN